MSETVVTHAGGGVAMAQGLVAAGGGGASLGVDVTPDIVRPTNMAGGGKPPRRGFVAKIAEHWAQMPAWRLWFYAAVSMTAVTAGSLVFRELKRSDLQSWYLSNLASRLTYKVEPGPSDAIVFPESGPFDERLGYAIMPKLIERSLARGFRLEEQSRLSPEHLALVKKGLYPIYREKAQAGLSILDRHGKPLFKSAYPQLIYQHFEDIPDVVVKTLLYIENRELLDTQYPHKNPTIEWDRLGLAVMDMIISKIIPGHDVPGGSTLATQIEKYRHSPEGRTSSMGAKAVQMASASVRAYMDGPDTSNARRRIITDYINSVPLGAIPGAGEVRGLGHGMVAWHGTQFDRMNELLRDVDTPTSDPELLATKARAYKEMLSLFLSQRRPAFYLQSNREALKGLTQKHLGSLERAGVITASFRDAVSKQDLSFRNNMIMFQPERLSFVERKAANAVRVHLLQLFGFDRLYALDRLDLRVNSTIDYDTQSEVTKFLQQLKKPDFEGAATLREARLLAKGDPKDVIYSFTLREHVGNANVLRVQADNVDGPFNVSEGGKLELGSTAKLRTLISYLQIMEELWKKYSNMSPAALRAVKLHPADRLSQWAVQYFQTSQDKTLEGTLNAAMNRSYSASPTEVFFTGGGAHHFNNFEAKDNVRVVDVREALRKSINLPFVRMMREVAYFQTALIPGAVKMLEDPTDPRRRQYLARFANKEGKEYLGHFFLHYRGLTAPAILKTFLTKIRPSTRKLAAIYSVISPDGEFAGFSEFVDQHLPDPQRSTARIRMSAFKDAKSDNYSLQDKGYIAGVHPLELWLVSYLYRMPNANFAAVVDASAGQRQEAYEWLFKSRGKEKQDRRIKIMLEQEAFQGIHTRWAALGYPFASLVPTYATALGSSGDKPAALAELMGVILADGLRYGAPRVDEMHFAENTPFETTLVADHPDGVRVLSSEIATIVRGALRSVVDEGTAQRIKGAFTMPDGQALVIGGKTGTGDNRYSIFAPGGRVIESKIMSRTATFVFYIGDRFFGTLTAYVPSEHASTYNFTSALPVQILKLMAPKLMPLLSDQVAHH